ncbi:MAG: glycerol-3-phosphate 1-O-acyltransferase PlsY [Lentimicrobiaceae bacterium]|jgi:glycerol-3-phosphate acyltransferase PlsY|nr:glycerol-3-phosphate 1-O-acyltransferase PlsY [Lentimicrobiaceae bacterium]
MLIGYLFAIFCAYLLGSIPTAVWIGKLFFGVDVRTQGSGNAGATNTIRVLGLKAGIPVLLIDVSKGFAAVKLAPLIFTLTGGGEATAYLSLACALAVVLGHIFPVFAGFRGGKGVATLLGVALGLFPHAALCALCVFVILLLATGYVSVGSIFAGLSFPFFVVFLFPPSNEILQYLAFFVAILLLFTHRKNMKRLLNGSESKTLYKKNNR